MLYQVKTVLYETSKLNKVQLCMDCLHFCKQHHLESVYILETVNNSVWLCFSFTFHFEVLCTKELLISKREHNLVASKSSY